MDTPEIIYQNNDYLVLVKPAGWIVNSASTNKVSQVLQDWLKTNFDYPIAKDWEMRSGIVHRLDKETSGVIIIAKTKEAFHYLQSQFKERKVSKEYIALVHGKIDKGGMIDMPVGRLPWNRERFGVLPGGREAQTGYEVLGYYEYNKEILTLIKCLPKTGRTHQIRIHMKHIGHPLVADHFYAGRKTSRKDRVWCSRLFLHASSIAFTNLQGVESKYEAKLAGDLEEVLKKLQQL